MKRLAITAAALTLFAGAAHANLNVLACEGEWAALAKELGGDHVKAESATTPFQDVHYIQARPSLIARVRRADLMICTGADLEVGWLPLLLRQGGNSKVQVGQPGFFAASDYVDMLEKPATVDRSQGDIHPYGNPHIQTDPGNIAKVAAALAQRLQQLDPDNASDYQMRYQDFAGRWQAAMQRWNREIAPLAGMQIVVHHKSWIYLAHWAKLEEAGALEAKPGLPPSAAHLAELLGQIQSKDVRLIVRAAYQDGKASEWLSQRTDIPYVVLPHTPGSVPGADDLFSMFDVIVKTLLGAQS